MALLRKGLYLPGWFVGFLITLIFGWIGWSSPPWAEAARYRGNRGFNEGMAIGQGKLFDAQLAEERSRRMMAQTRHQQGENPRLRDTSPSIRPIQPQQTLKVETVKPGEGFQPRQAYIKVEFPQPQQAFGKVESPRSQQAYPKVESPRSQQAYPKVESPQPQQAYIKVESIQSDRPLNKGYFGSMLQGQSDRGKAKVEVKGLQKGLDHGQPQQPMKVE